jgi:hypothetical protein
MEIKGSIQVLTEATSATTQGQALSATQGGLLTTIKEEVLALAAIQEEVLALVIIQAEALAATKGAIIRDRAEETFRIEDMEETLLVGLTQRKVDVIMVIRVLEVCMEDILDNLTWGLIRRRATETRLATITVKEDRITKRIDYTKSGYLYNLSI